jgi:hypothetical protein
MVRLRSTQPLREGRHVLMTAAAGVREPCDNEVALVQTWITRKPKFERSQLLISDQVTHRTLVCRSPPGAPASTAADYAATPQTSFPHSLAFQLRVTLTLSDWARAAGDPRAK